MVPIALTRRSFSEYWYVSLVSNVLVVGRKNDGSVIPSRSRWWYAEPAPPRWLVVALAGLAVLGLLEELATGDSFVGTAATIAFVALHISWPLAITWPPIGALTCLVANFFLVYALDRVGLPAMSAMIALFAVAALSPAAIAVSALVSFCLWALWATTHFDAGSAFFWGLVLLLLVSAAAGSFVRLVVLKLIASRRRVGALQTRVEQVRRDERAVIARELHDIVAHELTLISLQSAASRRNDDPRELRAILAKVNDTSRSALTELRTLLGVLRHDGMEENSSGTVRPLEGVELPEAISRITHKIEGLGIPLDLTMTEHGWGDVRVSTQEATFRIVQEALTNVTKHASTEPCQVDIVIAQDQVNLFIASGLPHPHISAQPDPALSSKQGLIGIRERANLLGGSVSAKPVDGRWVVRASLPA